MALFLQHGIQQNTNGQPFHLTAFGDKTIQILFTENSARIRQKSQQNLQRLFHLPDSPLYIIRLMLQEDKEIGYSPEGKPYLTDHSFFISIFHTKGYVAVMLASFTPAGIDIEQYAQRVHKVSDRYIRSDEQTEPYQGDMTWGLLLHWSAKEAVFKRMENADADLRKLRLTHFIPQEQGTFQVQELATEQQELYSVGYRICPDFVLTWTLS